MILDCWSKTSVGPAFAGGNDRHCQFWMPLTLGEQPLRRCLPVAQADSKDRRDSLGQLEADRGAVRRGKHESLEGACPADTVRRKADLLAQCLRPVDGKSCVAIRGECCGPLVAPPVGKHRDAAIGGDGQGRGAATSERRPRRPHRSQRRQPRHRLGPSPNAASIWSVRERSEVAAPR